MKIITLIITITILAGVVALVYKPSKKNTTEPRAITFGNLQQSISTGAKFYDVRTSEEFNTGHFSGAINWPLQDIQAGKLPDATKDTAIFLYCRSGNRSAQATAMLKNAGYTDVTDLHGVASVESMGGKLITN